MIFHLIIKSNKLKNTFCTKYELDLLIIQVNRTKNHTKQCNIFFQESHDNKPGIWSWWWHSWRKLKRAKRGKHDILKDITVRISCNMWKIWYVFDNQIIIIYIATCISSIAKQIRRTSNTARAIQFEKRCRQSIYWIKQGK